jgi:hypothetical protein
MKTPTPTPLTIALEVLGGFIFLALASPSTSSPHETHNQTPPDAHIPPRRHRQLVLNPRKFLATPPHKAGQNARNRCQLHPVRPQEILFTPLPQLTHHHHEQRTHRPHPQRSRSRSRAQRRTPPPHPSRPLRPRPPRRTRPRRFTPRCSRCSPEPQPTA